MHSRRIQIEPSWTFRDDEGRGVDPQLFQLLRAIHLDGRLTQASKRIGISYRHAWNQLNRWSDFFGSDVVALEKGRGARLTPLGEKLLWAEQRVAARMQPQMDNLASEINIELQRLVDNEKPMLRIHASHGYAVALLPRFSDGIRLDLQYTSAAEALQALERRACDVAGFHLPQKIRIPELRHHYASLIGTEQIVAVRFVSRQQGLMVAPGNPLGIQGIADLRRKELKFINRQGNSGTRLLLDQLLADAAMDTKAINGFDDQEFTHGAIAAYVAAGMADLGFGVKAAAAQFGLDFIELAVEDYILLYRKESQTQVGIQAFLEAIRTQEFVNAVEDLAGYSYAGCKELSLAEYPSMQSNS